QARAASVERAGLQPHIRPASLVPALTPGPRRQPLAGFLRLERDEPAIRRGADHLQGLRDLELDLGPPGRRLLLASVLLPPARPQLRQPTRPPGHLQSPGL